MDLTDIKYVSCCAHENGGCGPYLRYRAPVALCKWIEKVYGMYCRNRYGKDNSKQCNKNVTDFHSVVFEESGMRMHRYFEIGDGIIQKYSDECDFQSGLIVIKPFHSTENMVSITFTPSSTS